MKHDSYLDRELVYVLNTWPSVRSVEQEYYLGRELVRVLSTWLVDWLSDPFGGTGFVSGIVLVRQTLCVAPSR